MARKFEWRSCRPYAPGHIPGVVISEIEHKNTIAFGSDLCIPKEGPCLSIDESVEILKKLKKCRYKTYRIERIERPTGGFVMAFVGVADDSTGDDKRCVGILAPYVRTV